MRTCLTLLLLSVITFSGCNGKNSNINSNTSATGNANANSPLFKPIEIIKPEGLPNPNFQPCNLYAPLVPGSQLNYTLQYPAAIIADVNVVVGQAEENGKPVFIQRTQIIDNSGGLYKYELTERKFVCDNGRLQLISEKTENRTEKNASNMEMEFPTPAYAFPEPAAFERKGSTWSYNFKPIYSIEGTPRIQGEATTISFEVTGEETVKVPAGEFKAIKIARKVKDALIVEYYVKGIGMVKRVGNDGSYWELKGFSGVRDQP